MSKQQIILGLDPGYGITGYGVILKEGSSLKCLDYGVIRTEKGEEFSQRIKTINIELKFSLSILICTINSELKLII